MRPVHIQGRKADLVLPIKAEYIIHKTWSCFRYREEAEDSRGFFAVYPWFTINYY